MPTLWLRAFGGTNGIEPKSQQRPTAKKKPAQKANPLFPSLKPQSPSVSPPPAAMKWPISPVPLPNPATRLSVPPSTSTTARIPSTLPPCPNPMVPYALPFEWNRGRDCRPNKRPGHPPTPHIHISIAAVFSVNEGWLFHPPSLCRLVFRGLLVIFGFLCLLPDHPQRLFQELCGLFAVRAFKPNDVNLDFAAGGDDDFNSAIHNNMSSIG